MNKKVVLVAAAGVGAGVLAMRGTMPKLSARFQQACESMFERMPEDFPPKQIMHRLEVIDDRTDRILRLLEGQATEAPVTAAAGAEGRG